VQMRVRSSVGSVPITVTLPQLPDLVVAAFDSTDFPFFNESEFELAVSVTIRNDGNVPADTFLVAAMYTSAVDTFGVHLVAARFTPSSTTAPIAPGKSETIAGTVFWGADLQGQTLRLHMLADACSSDGPTPCRIDEFNENNNASQEIQVHLPPL